MTNLKLHYKFLHTIIIQLYPNTRLKLIRSKPDLNVTFTTKPKKDDNLIQRPRPRHVQPQEMNDNSLPKMFFDK